MSDRTGSWEWKLRRTFFILESKKCLWVNLPGCQLCSNTCSLVLWPHFPSLRGFTLPFQLVSGGISEYRAGCRQITLSPSTGNFRSPVCNKLVQQLLPSLFYLQTLFKLKWCKVKLSPVCTHLFMMSSCFSLASSYLSAKRSAISRRLFLKAREKQFLTPDSHTGQARVWKEDEEEDEEASWRREQTHRLHYGWECLHLAPVSHRALSKPPPQVHHSWGLTWQRRQVLLTSPLDSNSGPPVVSFSVPTATSLWSKHKKKKSIHLQPDESGFTPHRNGWEWEELKTLKKGQWWEKPLILS